MFRYKQQQQQQHKQWSARSEQQVHTTAGCDWGNRQADMCQVWIEPKRTQDEKSLIMCSKIFTYDLNRERHQTNICWKQIKCWEAEARWLLTLISILTSDIARFLFSAFLDILLVCRHCARKDSGAWGAHGGREVRTAVDVTHRRSRHFYDFSRRLS